MDNDRLPRNKPGYGAQPDKRDDRQLGSTIPGHYSPINPDPSTGNLPPSYPYQPMPPISQPDSIDPSLPLIWGQHESLGMDQLSSWPNNDESSFSPSSPYPDESRSLLPPSPTPSSIAYANPPRNAFPIWQILICILSLSALVLLVYFGKTHLAVSPSPTATATNTAIQGTATAIAQVTGGSSSPVNGATSVPVGATPTKGATTPPTSGPGVTPTVTPIPAPVLGSSVDDVNLTFAGGGWNHKTDAANRWYHNTFSWSSTASDTATLTFTGRRVVVHGATWQSGGIANIIVNDGNGNTVTSATIDTYSTTTSRVPTSIYISPDLPNQPYKITITVAGMHNANATSDAIALDYIDIYV
jgi:hypothetical protein